jgi:hypothetical protein
MKNENTANPMSRGARRRLGRGQMAFPEKNFTPPQKKGVCFRKKKFCEPDIFSRNIFHRNGLARFFNFFHIEY